MSDTPEVIRQQMEETKTHLSEKLESLEHQVSETVQSTGTAVNATVEAVQETVETVTGAVQDAVQSVSNAFDIRRQMEKHPMLVLGGVAVLGYLAGELLMGPGKKPVMPLQTTPIPPASPSAAADNTGGGSAQQSVESAAVAAAITAAFKSGLDSSFSYQLKGQAIAGLMGIVQEVAARAVPLVMDYLAGHRTSADVTPTSGTGEGQGVTSQPETSDAAQHLHIASTENVRSTKSS